MAVLFHGSWTQESQHAVGILQHLACRLERRLHDYSFPPKPPRRARDVRGPGAGDTGTTAGGSTSTSTVVGAWGAGGGGCGGEPTKSIVLAEADVMTLIEVADRQAIAALPSLHLHLGGREIVRFRVERGESVESLCARIDEIASRVERAAGRI